MDILLSKVTQQAMNYAIRSGITITSGYAIRQCSRLLKTTTKSTDKDELATLQLRLESKIRIISPAIDMIELIAARGNTSLESAVTLTKSIRWEIQSLGVRLAKAATEEEATRRGSSKARSSEQNALELKLIISDIKKLLARIEDAVPLINLAITTSGVSLSTNLPSTVSPSRLLQASTFLTAGDSRYAMVPGHPVQIGPVYTMSMYMLFSGHSLRPHNEDGIRETTWKEVIHKARVKLMRIPVADVYKFPGSKEQGLHRPSNGHFTDSSGEEYFPAEIPSEGKAYEFAYQLLIVEDLDDDRVHTFEENEPQPGPFDDVALAGIREIVPIHEISKIFYADTGKILNIGAEGETNNPILLLKRDINADPPRRMMEQHEADGPQWYDEPSTGVDDGQTSDEEDESAAQLRRESSSSIEQLPEPEEPVAEVHSWRLPANLDPEWIAFEVYTEDPPSEDEEDITEVEETSSPTAAASSRSRSGTPGLSSALEGLSLRSPMSPSPQITPNRQVLHAPAPPTDIPAIRTSLSLLELLIRLTALQQYQQSSHLAIDDEHLNFFLQDSSSVGAGADSALRRRVRREARMRVGFDPYNESPIKRHTEQYIANGGHDGHSRQRSFDGYGSERGYTPEPQSPDAYPTSSVWRDHDDDEPPLSIMPTPSRHNSNMRSSASPSPLLRRSRTDRAGTPERQSLSRVPSTPPDTTKSRQAALKREGENRRPSPLSRAFPGGHDGGRDSGVGTSPDA